MSDCTYQSVSTVYLGFDNAVTVVPYADITERTYYDMSTVSSVTVSADPLPNTVQGDAFSATSADVPTVVWWEQVGTTAEWRIHSKVGLFTGIVAGSFNLRIIIYDTPHPNGLVLTDGVAVEVVDTP